MGGCDDDGDEQTKCYGLTEIYDPEIGWTSHAGSNFPVLPGILTGHALVSDPAGIIIITDTSLFDNTVYRLVFLRNDLFRWDTLGKLQEPAFYLSVTRLLGDIFIGYDDLERITITEEGMSSVVYETGFNLHMDYSPMIHVDADYCADY